MTICSRSLVIKRWVYTDAMLERYRYEHGVPPPVEREGITDVLDAREHVEELIATGVRPVITIPKEFAEDVIEYGITSVPKHDLRTGKKFSFVAGVIGIDPYLPESEERLVFEIDPSQVRIEPRLTGSDTAFHGVVGFPDGIPASALTPLGSFTDVAWKEGIRKGPLH